jgi:four helix bundle protein
MIVLKDPARNFQDLFIWKKAHRFVLDVYSFTSKFPGYEIYGLTFQFRRAAISIPANIAEGFKKNGHADKIRFMNIAQGSLEECRYYLILTNDLGYCDSSQLLQELDKVSKSLDAYSNSIRNKHSKKV